MDERGWRSKNIDITFPREAGQAGMLKALDRVCAEAEQAIDAGYSLVILSDRQVSAERVPLSSLLACGAVHHHLVQHAKRTRIGIILETGEAREVHHHCLLVGYGADAINPYLAFEALWRAREQQLREVAEFTDDDQIVAAYRKGVAKGMLKVMAKMGISTLQSYKGAQIFEAVGLRAEVIDRCFVGTPSRVQGVGFAVLAEETFRRHQLGYPAERDAPVPPLLNVGEYHWRSAGEKHAWDPAAITDLQVAARTNSHQAYQRFAEHINSQAKTACTLRGLIEFRPAANGPPLPLDEVEPAQRDRQAILYRRHELRFDFGGSSRDPGDCHESSGREEQHG